MASSGPLVLAAAGAGRSQWPCLLASPPLQGRCVPYAWCPASPLCPLGMKLWGAGCEMLAGEESRWRLLCQGGPRGLASPWPCCPDAQGRGPAAPALPTPWPPEPLPHMPAGTWAAAPNIRGPEPPDSPVLCPSSGK